jgi:hypothetical protein
MSAVIIALEYPYYAVSNAVGEVTISSVPAGRYLLNVWHERCLPEALKSMSRGVAFSQGSTSIGEVRVPESGDLLTHHKNMYGRDYDPAAKPYPGAY